MELSHIKGQVTSELKKFIKSRSSDATIEGLSDQTIFSLDKLLRKNEDLTVTSGYRDPELPKYENFNKDSDHSKENPSHAADIRVPGYQGTALKAFIQRAARAGVGSSEYEKLKQLLSKLYGETKDAGFKDFLVEKDHIHLSSKKSPYNEMRFLSTNFDSDIQGTLNSLATEIKAGYDNKSSTLSDKLKTELQNYASE